jgi:hypothetical protein
MTRTYQMLMVLVVSCLVGTILLTAGCANDSPVAPAAVPPANPLLQADSAPPATPTGVYAQVRARQVKVGWQPNVTDPDCVGFTLDRTAAGATVHLITVPHEATVFVDTHPFAGVAVYQVYAVDAAGNASAAATFAVDFYADGVQLEDGR